MQKLKCNKLKSYKIEFRHIEARTKIGSGLHILCISEFYLDKHSCNRSSCYFALYNKMIPYGKVAHIIKYRNRSCRSIHHLE